MKSKKYGKYQELAADQTNIWEGYRADVIPVVIGDLGVVQNLNRHLRKANLWKRKEVDRLVSSIQREVLCGAVCIVRRHMVNYGEIEASGEEKPNHGKGLIMMLNLNAD